MKLSTPLLLFLLGGIIFAAGCTVPLSPGTSPSVTTAPVPAVTSVPTPSPSPVPSSTTFWPDASRIGEFTTVPTTRPAPDNPHLDYLNIRKRTFVNPIPRCLMENAFPAIAKDPVYGIQQVVPKLSAVSEEDYEAFLRKYTEGKAENTQLKTPALCQNTENEPVWNFIEVRVVLVGTRPDPTDYTVTENILSDGKIVARFTSAVQLTIDQQLVLVGYIPIHASEVDLFDSVDLTFTRR
jgi:hypothetical protein